MLMECWEEGLRATGFAAVQTRNHCSRASALGPLHGPTHMYVALESVPSRIHTRGQHTPFPYYPQNPPVVA
jgi:hypothetical protein